MIHEACIWFVLLGYLGTTLNASSLNFDLKYAESPDGSILANLQQPNYGIISDQLADNWRAVSVNGQDVFIVDKTGNSLTKTLSNLSTSQRQSIDDVKRKLDPILAQMTAQGSTATSTRSNFPVRIEYHPRTGPIASVSNGYPWSANKNSYYENNIQFLCGRSGDDFTGSRPNLPNNWAKIIVKGDMVTTVTNDGGIQIRAMLGLPAKEQLDVKDFREELRALFA